MPWNNGAWWPIYVPEWWFPVSSHTPLDPYSFVHLQAGVICFYIFGYPLWYFLKDKDVTKPPLNSWQLWVGFAIMFLFSLTFEIIENLRCNIEQWPHPYDGDSYQNIIADLIVVQLGYMISWVFSFLGVPWVSAIWFLVVDVSLILYMRDSVLLFFNVFLKNQGIIDWQANGVKLAKERKEKNQSIVCPFSVCLKTQDG